MLIQISSLVIVEHIKLIYYLPHKDIKENEIADNLAKQHLKKLLIFLQEQASLSKVKEINRPIDNLIR